MVIATIAAENYLPKAVCLARTIRRMHPDAIVILCLVEKTMPDSVRQCHSFDCALLAADIGIPHFQHMAFRHVSIELATAVKPMLLRHLMAVFPDHDTFVYLDPDIDMHGPLVEAEAQLKTTPIVVTPHHVNDVTRPQDVIDTVFPVLRCGVFNLGFLALTRSDVTDQFLSWWAHKVSLFCYVDYALGLFVDQKWVDLASGMFPLGVLRHPGYNVARWNIAQRPIVGEIGSYSVAGSPLRFVHFSQIDIGKDLLAFRRYAPAGDEPIHEIRRRYRRTISAIRTELGPALPWSYDCYESGERIAPDVRMACRQSPQLLARTSDPYGESNEFFFAQ